MKGKEDGDTLPASFVWSSEDPFYYGPATCELLHYKPASFMAAGVEFIIFLAGSLAFWEFYNVNKSMDQWLVFLMFGLFVCSIITSGFMFVGIANEKPTLLLPKIAFIRLWIMMMVVLAFVSIAVMSVGIDLTNHVFSYVVRVNEMERDFGPLWPFNISVVSFFAAALSIWTRVLVTGAYDFIQDKEHFSQQPVIELEKTLPQPE